MLVSSLWSSELDLQRRHKVKLFALTEKVDDVDS